MLAFFTEPSCLEFQVRYLALFHLISSYFISNRYLQVVLDRKSLQEYPVNTRILQGFILGSTLFLLYINDFPDDVFCNITRYADNTTFYSKCDQVSVFVETIRIGF